MAADDRAGADALETGPTPEELNDTYGIGEAVRFVAGPGGFPVAALRSPQGTASVSLLGATVVAYQPRDGAPVLFVSRRSAYAAGQPIRGGIPVCWPWFGPHPGGAALPNHGLVRTRLWRVEEAGTAPGGETELTLRLDHDVATLESWPHPFTLRLTTRLGATLRVTLEVLHPGAGDGAPEGTPEGAPESGPFLFTGALHTYLAVGDASRITIGGLEGASYVDKVGQGAVREQRGPVQIEGETDRVYLDTAATVTVDDPALGRRLSVAKGGSRTTVVWNPWEGRARALPDFGDDEFRDMVCVETANALEDAVTLAPGERHLLETELSAAPWYG